MWKLKENKTAFGTAFNPSKLLNEIKYKRMIGRDFKNISFRYLKVYIINF
tara:strand:+ start:456 stop:605 length:150 start_codon:yes stop_codon:yes gene_type:complete